MRWGFHAFQRQNINLCKQLDRMIVRIRTQSVSIKNLKNVSGSLDAIYQYFGRDMPASHVPQSNLNKRFEHTPCIFDKAGKLWLAKHVFANEVPCFGARRLHFPSSEITTAKGLDRLACVRIRR